MVWMVKDQCDRYFKNFQTIFHIYQFNMGENLHKSKRLKIDEKQGKKLIVILEGAQLETAKVILTITPVIKEFLKHSFRLVTITNCCAVINMLVFYASKIKIRQIIDQILCTRFQSSYKYIDRSIFALDLNLVPVDAPGQSLESRRLVAIVHTHEQECSDRSEPSNQDT